MGQFEEGVKLVVGHNFDNNRKQPRLSIKKMVSGKHDKCSEDLIYIENLLNIIQPASGGLCGLLYSCYTAFHTVLFTFNPPQAD